MATIYLTLEQVLLVHDEQIELFGGSHGIRDLTLLESAIMRPQSTFGGNDLYSTTFEKAAVLMHSLVLNHPFVDANKRTGVVSALVFLEVNKYVLNVANTQLVETALKVATKKWGIEEIAKWLKKHSTKI